MSLNPTLLTKAGALDDTTTVINLLLLVLLLLRLLPVFLSTSIYSSVICTSRAKK